MRFTKMQGLGNDYVYIDGFAGPLPADLPAFSRAVSDRHFGIGSDGLIAIVPPTSAGADARMRMFNADGSESEMCGNGLRCVAKYVHDRGIAGKPKLTLETGRGLLTVDLEIHAGKVRRVRVNMGAPILRAAIIPVTFPDSPVVNVTWPLLRELAGGIATAVTCVSMGNPHAVVFCSDVATVPLEAVGPKLETDAHFPKRVNVHFVQVHSPSEVTMRTWERGSGITLACGTGACAVAVAGILTGRTGPKLLAHLPGGALELEWAGGTEPVFMTGPAVEVFSGDWPGDA